MSDDRKIIEKAVSHALRGKGAHVEGQKIFAGLDWKLAGVRPEGVPHSLFQLLNHLTFWQDWAVKWLDGHAPATPRHASASWPGDSDPADRKQWELAVRAFQNGLDELDRRCRQADILSKPGQKSRLEMLHTIASHNSYHAGQVVLLRQILRAWPPPSGGLTW